MSRGRPPRIRGEIASARIWAWLTNDERQSLRALSEETGKPIAEIVREAVNVYVADFSEQRVFSVTGNSRAPLSCPHT